jgi:polygalacturonase
MYRLYLDHPVFGKSQSVNRIIDGASIPFASDNTDYANFKKDLADGAELQDAEGNVIDGIAYLEELV